MYSDDIIDDSFTVEEIEETKKPKCGKASGIDGLQPEQVKASPYFMDEAKSIYTLDEANLLCLYSEYIPSSLLTGIIQTIYKEKGKDPLSCHNYRGNTMTLVVMKVSVYYPW